MNLDDITTYTSALEAITVAITDLPPELAAEALLFVLRVVEPTAVPIAEAADDKRSIVAASDAFKEAAERLSSHAPAPAPAPAPIAETTVEKSPIRDQVAEKLVAEGWDHPTALKAAKEAITMRGKSSGLITLVAQAKALGENSKHSKPKTRTPKEARARHDAGEHRPPIRNEEFIQDAANFVRKHAAKGARTSQYAAKAGLTRAGAINRLRAARDAGLIRMVGEKSTALWFPVEKAAA
jgi:hypothetical protein